MKREILLATTNRGKVRELLRILGGDERVTLRSAGDFPQIEPPEETGASFEENAQLKALYYAARTGLPCVADDSGLVVDALGGRPGVMSARYAPSDAERIVRLLDEMRAIPDDQRAARFVCAAAFALPGTPPRIVALERGELEGSIAHEARGTHGFGFDPVFYVTQLGCHLAEVPADVKNTISHRARAFEKLRPHLERWLAGELL
jgi:XTP/dITP diphosphohydrolase